MNCLDIRSLLVLCISLFHSVFLPMNKCCLCFIFTQHTNKIIIQFFLCMYNPVLMKMMKNISRPKIIHNEVCTSLFTFLLYCPSGIPLNSVLLSTSDIFYDYHYHSCNLIFLFSFLHFCFCLSSLPKL